MKPTVLHFDQDLLIFITEPDASVSESGVNSNRSSRIASPCINRPRNLSQSYSMNLIFCESPTAFKNLVMSTENWTTSSGLPMVKTSRNYN